MDEVPLWTPIIIQLAVMAINVILAVRSVSIRSLNDGVIRKLAEDGDKDAINILDIENIGAKLSCALWFTVAVINVAGSIFGVYPLAKNIGYAMGDVISQGTVIKIILSVVAGLIIELITFSVSIIAPQNITEAKETEKTEKQHRLSVLVLYRILKPTVFLILKLSDLVSKLFGISSKDTSPDVTEDEIMMMVESGEESGAVESDEKEMIENVFNFSETAASEVMTHRRDVIAIWENDTEEEILKTIIDTGKSRFPVYSDDIDTISGILIARDYLLNLHSDDKKPLKELLRPAYLVPETVKTNVLFRDMQRENTHIAVVVDEYGGTAGIVTLEDLLEEIVGNIYDEFDEDDEDTSITKLEENVWRVAGNVDMETLSSALGTESDEDAEYDTVGGLVMSRLSSIPEDGSHPEVTVNGLYIYVEKIEQRRIEWVKISLIMGPAKEDEENEEDDN